MLIIRRKTRHYNSLWGSEKEKNNQPDKVLIRRQKANDIKNPSEWRMFKKNATEWINKNKRWIKSIKTAPKQLMIKVKVNGGGRLGERGCLCLCLCVHQCVRVCKKERLRKKNCVFYYGGKTSTRRIISLYLKYSKTVASSATWM